MERLFRYFAVAVLFWFVVDFTTTQAIRNPIDYYSTYMPALMIFYLGYPFVFSVLIYRFGLTSWKLLVAAAASVVVAEGVFFQNPLLLTFPLMLIGIPAAACIYGLITYGPKWIVDGDVKKNRWKLSVMTAVYLLVSLLTLVGGSGP